MLPRQKSNAERQAISMLNLQKDMFKCIVNNKMNVFSYCKHQPFKLNYFHWKRSSWWCRLIGVDCYSFDQKLYHIAEHVQLPDPPKLGRGHAALPPDKQLPPLLVMNIQLPLYKVALIVPWATKMITYPVLWCSVVNEKGLKYPAQSSESLLARLGDCLLCHFRAGPVLFLGRSWLLLAVGRQEDSWVEARPMGRESAWCTTLHYLMALSLRKCPTKLRLVWCSVSLKEQRSTMGEVWFKKLLAWGPSPNLNCKTCLRNILWASRIGVPSVLNNWGKCWWRLISGR